MPDCKKICQQKKLPHANGFLQSFHLYGQPAAGLCHAVCRFVFINHLGVILLFCLDMIEQFPYIGSCKLE